MGINCGDSVNGGDGIVFAMKIQYNAILECDYRPLMNINKFH